MCSRAQTDLFFLWVLKSVWNYASQIPTTLAAPAAPVAGADRAALIYNEYALGSRVWYEIYSKICSGRHYQSLTTALNQLRPTLLLYNCNIALQV